jgi:bifunctional UDP-N-acetylglucosamine pyrophosphorylase/glucosamine-1-phosphate N-acetyltransferase
MSRIPGASAGPAIFILAAGEGTRMQSQLPKVLHKVLGRTLIEHVIDAANDLNPSQLVVVVGAHRELVEEVVSKVSPGAKIVVQEKRGGTGHAVRMALESVKVSAETPILVLAGDIPLITSTTLQSLLETHVAEQNSATVLTAQIDDPEGYGRIVRDETDGILRIVEDRDATEIEREITEINSSVYVFDSTDLVDSLSKINNKNAQGEEYLTDAIGVLQSAGKRVEPVIVEDFIEILGVNDRFQLSECTALLRDRINLHWMKSGVTMIDPTTVWIDPTVSLSQDVVIYPEVALAGNTSIESGVVIGARTTLINCEVKSGANIRDSYCDGAKIGADATVGPFSYLRPGTVLEKGVKVGAYVEVKESQIGAGSKVPHLSYIGDATIGVGTNIGAATVTVNYDGVEKHQTVIGDHVRIGSDTMLVAPLSIGDGAYTAAGSVITEDVPAGSMGVGRARQRNILGWVLRKRSGSDSAKAAEKNAK